MHVADVDLTYRHSTLDERKHVLRSFGHDKDLLLGRRLRDDVDGVLQREETGGDAGRGRHLHEVLTHGVAGNLVVGDEDEVGAQGGVPLGRNLTMNQAVIDTGEKNVGLCHDDPFLSCTRSGLLHPKG